MVKENVKGENITYVLDTGNQTTDNLLCSPEKVES